MNHQNDASTAGVATPANEKALEAATNSDKGLGKIDSGSDDFRSASGEAQIAQNWGLPIGVDEEGIAGFARLIEHVAGAVPAAEFSRKMLDANEAEKKAKQLKRQAARLNTEAKKLGSEAYSLRKRAWDAYMSAARLARDRQRGQP